MKIIYSPKCLEYSEPGHPESPERVSLAYDFLKDKFDLLEPKPCSEQGILRVHTKELLEKVKSGNFYDLDTPALPDIFDYAKLSAGAAILAAGTALKQENTFSLMRPPGHHVGKDFLSGFCYFNNIAIAVKFVQERLGLGRVAILDIDCHHGNGTQDIFLGVDNVLYVSLHRHPFYPGTGQTSEKNCLNFPLRADITEPVYLKTLQLALEKIREFRPQLLAISAGFDTYEQDPIASLGLSEKSYVKIGLAINELKLPFFVVLEGGYSQAMPFCIDEFLSGCSKI